MDPLPRRPSTLEALLPKPPTSPRPRPDHPSPHLRKITNVVIASGQLSPRPPSALKSDSDLPHVTPRMRDIVNIVAATRRFKVNTEETSTKPLSTPRLSTVPEDHTHGRPIHTERIMRLAIAPPPSREHTDTPPARSTLIPKLPTILQDRPIRSHCCACTSKSERAEPKRPPIMRSLSPTHKFSMLQDELASLKTRVKESENTCQKLEELINKVDRNVVSLETRLRASLPKKTL